MYSNRLKKANNPYVFELSTNNKESREFIRKHHYSTTSPSTKYFFNIKSNCEIVGAMAMGQVIGRFQSKKYYPQNPDKLIELRRLVLIDATPKNTETWFISQALKWLKKNSDYEAVLSLADQNFNHQGTIYKAANFKLIGEDMDKRDRILIKGKEYHPRTLYDMHGTSSVKFLKNHYKDDIKFIKKKRKLVYIYYLK